MGFKSASNYETFVWVRDKELPETNEVIQVKSRRAQAMLYECLPHQMQICVSLQISVDKNEIPLLGGQYVLGYYSTNLQRLTGLSANFHVRVPLLLCCVIFSLY